MMVVMDRGSCTIVDEQSLIDCVNRSIASVHQYLGIFAGGDRARTEQLLIDVYTEMARFARAGPCTVPFEQLKVVGRRRFMTDARLSVRGPAMAKVVAANDVNEVAVVGDFGGSVALREVRADVPELARVADLERAVLVLHRLDGLTIDEIAAEAGVTPRRVTTLLRRGLRGVGLRSAHAIEADIHRLGGDVLVPSPDLMHAVRRHVVAEWRGEAVASADPPRPRTPRHVWIGAAAAVLAVFVGVAWSGAASVARPAADERADERADVPLIATSSPVCPDGFSTKGLAERSFAFDGDVVDTFSGTDITAGPVRTVTFEVRRWYRGGGRRQVTVRWRGDVEPVPGMRLLVSGDDRDGLPVAMGCGYSEKWRELDAVMWRTVLLTPRTRGDVPSGALGRLWVVTSVDREPWIHPVMPTFMLLSGGTMTGQDGCGVYHVDENGNSDPSTPCDEMPDPLQVRGPFEFSSPEPTRLTSEHVTAEWFDLGETDAPIESNQLVGEYSYGEVASVSLRVGGVVVVKACGATTYGTHHLQDGRLRFDLEAPACDSSSGFDEWLRQMATTGGLVSLHDGDAPGLWIDFSGHVTRLVG
jgi:Sigma-70, region 4